MMILGGEMEGGDFTYGLLTSIPFVLLLDGID